MQIDPIVATLIALVVLTLIFGVVLGYANVKYRVEGDPVVDQIDALLPQTQCGQCGHPGCKPYAESIANGEPINKCPPGGQPTINAIADLLGVEAPELDADHGEENPVQLVAVIDEPNCIGCTKCIQACPVDAILGAAKMMHTVIESECTGCDLCVDPCPTDCIDMVPATDGRNASRWLQPSQIIATSNDGAQGASDGGHAA